jgi:hypothetical protein
MSLTPIILCCLSSVQQVESIGMVLVGKDGATISTGFNKMNLFKAATSDNQIVTGPLVLCIISEMSYTGDNTKLQVESVEMVIGVNLFQFSQMIVDVQIIESSITVSNKNQNNNEAGMGN